MRDPAAIDGAIAASATQTSFPDSIHWQGYGIAQGYAGLAVACAYLDACFPGSDWDAIGHGYLLKAVRASEQVHSIPLGLFAGLSGVAFAAECLSRGGARYKNLLARLDEHLVPRIITRCGDLRRQQPGCSVSQFDVISGLTGIGIYLMSRRRYSGPLSALEVVLGCLVHLSEEQAGLPRWRCPPELLDPLMFERFPSGSINLGLAHGVPGPLALMSKALMDGIYVEGLPQAIARVADYLSAVRAKGDDAISWPDAVPLSEGILTAPPSSRPAWCYGSAGVARSLWLAGTSLNSPEHCELALQAMEAVYARPKATMGLVSPTFCHGLSGLLEITLRFYHDTGMDLFSRAAARLVEQILAHHDTAAPLGFYCVEPGSRRVDKPGLLDGSSGVVVTLLAATMPVEPVWDRLFLL